MGVNVSLGVYHFESVFQCGVLRNEFCVVDQLVYEEPKRD